MKLMEDIINEFVLDVGLRESGYGIMPEHKRAYDKMMRALRKHVKDNWNHLEDAAMNEHKGSELIEAVRELITAIRDDANAFEEGTLEEAVSKVEKLLGELKWE